MAMLVVKILLNAEICLYWLGNIYCPEPPIPPCQLPGPSPAAPPLQ